jgi:hypothetical protein
MGDRPVAESGGWALPVRACCSLELQPLLQSRLMRTRLLALLMALVVGLVAGWPALASPGQLPAVLAAASQDAPTQPQAGPANAPVEHRATEQAAEHWAELSGSQGFAEGASDLPALFFAGPDAHEPSATMAPPRQHAAASWQRLYLNVPRRPPRSLHAIA